MSPSGARSFLPFPSGSPSRRASLLLALVLLSAAGLRLRGLDWDEGNHLHPDERFISMVEEKVRAPESVREYFDSRRSPLNPYNKGEGSFVYGTLPLFLTKATAHVIGMPGYGGAYKVGRALSALFDLLTVWLVYRLARRFVDREFALAASALYAFAPLAIQSSHFWTVETTLAALSTLTLLGCVRMALGRSTPVHDLATGLALGLAVACKVTALALFAPLGVAALLRASAGSGPRPGRIRVWGRAAAGGALALVGAAAAVRCALPYVFLGPSPLSFRLDPRYLADLKNLANLSSSFAGFPPALQWADRSILFPVENFVLFGAGPAFGVLALLGAAWAAVAAWRAPFRALGPLLLYAGILGTYHGTALVKSIRYFFPIYPAFAVLAVAFLARAGGEGRPALRRLAAAVAVLGTVLSGTAFASVYTRPHTRVTASRWIQANVPAPARFANESWDDGLPLPIPGLDAGRYAGPVLDLWVPEDRAKVEAVVTALAGADWVAVTSGRVYANVTLIPDVYPMATAYYRALFSGDLGFRAEADFTSYPSLGPFRFPTDGAEEQFTVYDHPRVLLFRKTRAFTVERARALLSRAILSKPPTIWEWEKRPRTARRTVAPVRPMPRPRVEEASKVAAPVPQVPGSTRAALVWLGVVLLVGAAALPIAYSVFPGLADRGFGLAKTLGLLLATLLSTVALRAGGLGSPRRTAIAAFLGLLLVALVLVLRRLPAIARHVRERRGVLIAGELVFLAAFFLFLGLRSLNPEVTWGEKPMDFSLLNVLVRAESLPVSDPWIAGEPLGYYSFGHQAMALLTLLTGLPTRLTYNLAMALVAGLVAQGAFSLAFSWARSARAGLACAALLTLLGNLSGLREWLLERRPRGLPLDWHYFWATSRVVKDTINEYPLWGLLFADLHAHVLSLPFFLLLAAACLEFVRAHASPVAGTGRRVTAAVAVGLCAAAQALTNGWDVPFLGTLVLMTGFVAAGGELRARARVLAAASTILSGATALLVFGALRWSGAARPGFGWNGEAPAPLADILTIFGLFFFGAFAWWLAWDREERTAAPGARSPLLASLVVAALVLAGVLRSATPLCLAGALAFAVVASRRSVGAEVRLAAAFVSGGFGLAVIPQYLFVSDRMNSFFKLHLEAWLAFSVGSAVLVFGAAGRPGRFETWPRAVRAGLGLLACGALFTGVTATRGALDTARPTYRAGAPRPTLDGLAFLERSRPGELAAVEWLQSAVRGTPVLLEAQGPSYQDFSRISMMTGIPTVLGWEHHVGQRGNSRAEIERRRAAVAAIYASPDVERIRPLLERYRVAYVYVGWLEQATYPAAGLRKFVDETGTFEQVYANREARVFRVTGASGDGAVPMPVAAEPPAPPDAAPPAEEKETPPVIRSRGAAGLPFEGLREPRGVAVDAKGRLWLTDFGNSRLRLYDGAGLLLGGWGGRGSGPFGLREPSGISVRGERVLLADTWNGRVSLFDLNGAWKGSATGFFGPRGVAIGPDGRIWVADTGNHRVLVYRDLDAAPVVIGRQGNRPLEFSSPVGIATGPSGDVYVADGGNARIQVLSSSGAFRATIAVDRWKGPVEPQLALDERERLYTVSPGTDEVLAFDRSGRLLWSRGADDTGRKLAIPVGITVDEARSCLWVVNAGDGTVVRVDPKPPAP